MSLRRTALLAVALLAAGCKERSEVVVFHAASLSRAFGELGEELARVNPRLFARLEPSGSQVAARKVSELGLRADVVAVADAAVLERLLKDRAAWTLEFATNELVIAHLGHSRHTEELSSENWREVLLRPGVRLGRANPDLAPLGYNTLMAWQLAGGEEGELPARLTERCAPEHVAPDETELVALLQAQAIDYAFVYRSTAEDHRLKVTRLPPEVNLGRADLAERYAAAEVPVRMKLADRPVRLRGAPIVYALAVPRDAPNPDGARQLAELLVSAKGARLLERMGFRPLSPPRSPRPAELPASLRAAGGAP